MLTAIYDRLGQVISALVLVNGGKPPKIERHPRPRLAMHRVEERRRREANDWLNARLYPSQERGDD